MYSRHVTMEDTAVGFLPGLHGACGMATSDKAHITSWGAGTIHISSPLWSPRLS